MKIELTWSVFANTRNSEVVHSSSSGPSGLFLAATTKSSLKTPPSWDCDAKGAPSAVTRGRAPSVDLLYQLLQMNFGEWKMTLVDFGLSFARPHVSYRFFRGMKTSVSSTKG